MRRLRVVLVVGGSGGVELVVAGIFAASAVTEKSVPLSEKREGER
jgi:hypothetical protein